MLPVVWQVMRCTTDTEPCWVHTVTSDCFNRVIDFLTIRKHVEDWRHTAGILNRSTDIQ